MRVRSYAFLMVMAGIIVLATPLVPAGAVTLSPMEQLGKSMFFDADLSLNRNQSCATCHAPEAGWTGATPAINMHGAVYEGSIPGAFGDRKPPTSAYATFAPILHVDKKGTFVGGNFWDGRATGETLGSPAAEQAKGPFLNPVEQALPNAAVLVSRVVFATPPEYPVSFAEVWGYDPATEVDWADPSVEDYAMIDRAYNDIGYSIAAYEASAESNAFSSKFDAWKAGRATLTKQEAKGWSLFVGKGKCAKCHITTGSGSTPALFTDFTYDNLGLPKNPENPATIANPMWADPGLGGFLASRADYAAYAEDNWGKHKVPTLRNVAKGTPGIVKAYGHNGHFKSLQDIVHFYNTRDVVDWPDPEVADNVNTAELGNLGLSAGEEAAIVAFMGTLSDGYEAP